MKHTIADIKTTRNLKQGKEQMKVCYEYSKSDLFSALH